MDTNLIITGALALVALILILKFSGKFFKILLTILLIGGLFVFGYLYLNDIKSINDLHNKYCNNLSDRKDSLKCVCIVKPIEEDFNYRLSPQKIENMNNKTFVFELSRSLINKRSEIISKLKENNALNLLDEFKKDLKIPDLKANEN